MSKKTGQLLIVRVRFLNYTISLSCIPFLDKENNSENRRLPLVLRGFFWNIMDLHRNLSRKTANQNIRIC